MVSTWSSGTTLPPLVGNKPHNFTSMDGQFTFVDFLPECSEPGGIFSNPEFTNFRSLIDRANDWLGSNPKWQVKTCESIEFKCKKDSADSEKMVYLEYGEYHTRYIRGLRLWLTEKSNEDDKAQQIGYVNLVPEGSEAKSMFSFPVYESLAEVIARFNETIRSQPLPGRIINIESQEIKVPRSKKIEPDISMWSESGSYQKRFLFVLRIFFEISDGIPEKIGVADFLPDVIKKGGFISLPKYEPFSNVVEKASKWCFEQNDIRICNVQSLEIKMKRGQEVDTHKMDYTEHGNTVTLYMRIVRVAYTISEVPQRESNLTQLTCKTFVPVQLTYGLFVPEFETLPETRNRILSWVKATGVQIVSAETSALRMFTGTEAKYGTEASFTYNQAERNEYWIFVIRLYINGSYHEPPSEMLPPIPELEQTSCCVIL